MGNGGGGIGRVGHNSNTYILLFYYLLFYNFFPAAPKLALKLSARFPYKKHCVDQAELPSADLCRLSRPPLYPYIHIYRIYMYIVEI